jgi:hypothetical protein
MRAVPRNDWSKSIAITWDEKRRERSVVRVPGIKVPAGPPTVRSRRARWEFSSFYPRVFGAAYRFPLDTVAVNRGLKDGRGRTLVARDLDEAGGPMPLAVISWHLSQRLEDPLLVIAASPRLPSDLTYARDHHRDRVPATRRGIAVRRERPSGVGP